MDWFEMTELSYRKVNADEYTEVLKLAEKIWKSSFSEILPQDRIDYLYEFMYGGDIVKRQIQSGEQEYSIVMSYDEPIGYFSIQKLSDSEYKLNKLYLFREHQGKGFATDIMDKIKSDLQSKGVNFLMLTVNRGNARAIRFYEKYGFEITGEEDFDVGGGHIMDDYIMTLKL